MNMAVRLQIFWWWIKNKDIYKDISRDKWIKIPSNVSNWKYKMYVNKTMQV